MKTGLVRLWRGEVPLSTAFWEYAIVYGTLANLITTIGAMGLLAAGESGVLASLIFFLPLPYNILMVIAVWKSASRYQGRRLWADLARIAVVLWALAATAA